MSNEDKNLNTPQENLEDFAQLFKESESQREAEKGVFTARVVAVDNDGCLIDIGRKSEARVPSDEMLFGFKAEAGNTLPVVFAGRDASGQLLSVKRAVRRLQWEALKAKFDGGERVECRILRVRTEGLLAGLRAVPAAAVLEKFKDVPASLWESSLYPAEMAGQEIDIEDPRPLKRWIGQRAQVRILDIKSGGPVIVSRRKVVEENREESRKQMFAKAKAGDVITARVRKIMDTVVQLSSMGIECVLSQDDASWYPKANLARQFRPGDVFKVQIIKVDNEGQKFHVSKKVLMTHPADDIAKQFKAGVVVEGEVSRVLPRGGFFVRLPGLKRDAYIPAKETYEDSADVKEGAKIKATVMKVDRESVRLVLSQKRYERAQDVQIIKKYTSNDSPYSLGDLLNPVEGEE